METTGKVKDLRKSHFFKTVPEAHYQGDSAFKAKLVSDPISLPLDITGWWKLPRRPSYRSSNKRGGGLSAQVDVINDTTDQESRHEENSEFLHV